jgi:hypothetical protein
LGQISGNREFNREYHDFPPFPAFSAPNCRAIPGVCSEIPYATEQGIFSTVTGKFFAVTGKNREFSGCPVRDVVTGEGIETGE